MSEITNKTQQIDLNFENQFNSSERPIMYYPPSISDKVAIAYNRHDWRELNRLYVRWWDPWAEQWMDFRQSFWDA